jgi:mevalonate kinase
MLLKQYKVPAKAMLFGEYGVLNFFPAVGLTFYDQSFEVAVRALPVENEQDQYKVLVTSDFFPDGKLSFSLNDDHQDNFFYSLLFPWKKHLKHYSLEINILKSFPTNLGFGSSSALITSISLYLFEFFYHKSPTKNNQTLWSFMRQSLSLTQGKGSGYDIGVQLAGLLEVEQKRCVWSYENQTNSPVPIIKKLMVHEQDFKSFGCFLKTNIYADTKKILSLHGDDKKKFALMHGQIAKEFLDNFSIHTLHKLVPKAKLVGEAQGLFPQTDHFQKLMEKLKGLAFKTMGSGHGDCLWVLASKSQLLQRGFTEEDIAYSF